MASTTIPIQIIDDDDDEFDWEAAVQEIDVACQASKPFTWAPDVHSHQVTDVPTCLPIPDKRPGTSRQSTLDRFMGIPNSMPEIKKAHRDQDKANVEFDEMPSCVKIDAEAAKTWIYPVNIPLRDYQFSITRTALFSNTLVALPTGLGKTLIAAVVMYNYFRWFPEGGMILTPVLGDSMSGKIVFAAPSRPLVMQQIEACHNIVGIPQEWTIDMTGQVSPTRRSCFWKAKRVFFVTPQVLEKDIQSGSCLVKHLVCLVIDEAHRASGNYSYCVALRELMAVPVQLRILALSATPGSKQQAIQQIIDNLQISTLEYRNESDHDVIPYVHDRKIELIQVALGPDAVEINNLLLQVIRPFVARLCAVGVLQKRDFQTLSPCELLNSRDKFRQAPPEDLPHMKYGEVEGYFGVLITLYHIRKLLSSHGIRPACEMLEEKLKQGSFARLMSRNEVLGNARVLMQQSLSHGAPSPKLSKLLEVLIDHFKKKDPQNSRVIIFSNFRGSVRDIMDALTNISEYVKATEFIGQSSGKISKGQSQKVQQAVLEKFRAGQYNVIVATSIGEEGLDIMEVDLVICFDANISPLRMIQRMGRTGRKHEGRVVVLACEGSELKGYIRKQANSSAIKKHMRNGGMNSFNFHSSPRMIPHIFKPEVQFVELSIEQFVPRGKRVKDDQNIETPLYKDKLTDAEADLVMKYFPNMKENTWRPSLIAFPHFQAFPSRVHEVVHSFRTGMLIDTMQCLQGLSFSGDSKAFVFEDEAISDMCLRVETVEEHYSNVEGLQTCHSSPKEDPRIEDSEILSDKEKHYMPDPQGQNPSTHSFLFGSDFVSIDAFGRVLILSVPVLSSKEASHSKCTGSSSSILQNCFKSETCQFRASLGEYRETTVQVKGVSATRTSCKEDNLIAVTLCNSDDLQKETPAEVNGILQTPVSKKNISNAEDNADSPKVMEKQTPVVPADDSSNDFKEVELSPRLTNFYECGIVPESPVHETELSKDNRKGELMVPDHVTPSELHTGQLLKSFVLEKNEKAVTIAGACTRDIAASYITEEIRTPVLNAGCSGLRNITCASAFVEEIQTTPANVSNSSSSKDWHLSSGKTSGSVKQEQSFKRLRRHGDRNRRKPPENKEENAGPTENTESAEQELEYKRLRKHGYLDRRKPPQSKEENMCPTENLAGSWISIIPVTDKHGKGEKQKVKDSRVFIEEEAEVSSEVSVSDDEDDEQDDSYDGSFIDDRINTPAASTQAEASRSEMMAIYRRSLLSQSPMERLPKFFTDNSPDYVVPKARVDESGSSTGNANRSPQTHLTGFESTGRNSEPFELQSKVVSSEALPCTTDATQIGKESKIESRKRKLSFNQTGSVPVQNLDQEFLLQTEAACRDASLQVQGEKVEASGYVFDDDRFYEGIDLDAMEEQAAKLLSNKSEMSMQKEVIIPEPVPELVGSPTFDLGI